ncbi:MAG: hypothetical protein GF329_04680 [Candidatus Lokiarchaeota archaeon]|nr:hypothetical protein [Candidatus Lokiarchaeota archaeon]
MKNKINIVIICILFMTSIFLMGIIGVDNLIDSKETNNLSLGASDTGNVFGSSEVKLVSDGMFSYINPYPAGNAAIAMDNNTGTLHAVWSGRGTSEYGTDKDILYSYSIDGTAWSIPIVISDDETNWNTGDSNDPKIAIDKSSRIHVVWWDRTGSPSEWGNDWEIFYANYTPGVGWKNATAISGTGFNLWNSGTSTYPDIAIDSLDNLHIIWSDLTLGKWRFDSGDSEIFYINYTLTKGFFSNATIISDGFLGSYWNDESSSIPEIAIDKNDILHVIWEDQTDGKWGSDQEIMYVNRTSDVWVNATVISDNGNWWNTGTSQSCDITIDKNDEMIHVVWYDNTVSALWGIDNEIMYTNCSLTGGSWANASAVSGIGVNSWNDGNSNSPSIKVSSGGIIHLVFSDNTEGPWTVGSSETEIFYMNYSTSQGWSNATAMSGLGINNWNNLSSINPSMVVGFGGEVNVIWSDNSDTEWKSSNEYEILFSQYTINPGWTNATVISDTRYLNDNKSRYPSIAVGLDGTVHAVWQDWSNFSGLIGDNFEDCEILYSNYTDITGWSVPIVISDNSSLWSHRITEEPDITIDKNGVIHVVFEDRSILGQVRIMYVNYSSSSWSDPVSITGVAPNDWLGNAFSPKIAADDIGNLHLVFHTFYNDYDIYYMNYTGGDSWSNATLISDDENNWNTGLSRDPEIALDNSGNPHVVWEDRTDSPGEWGIDNEIFYTNRTPGVGWINATAISGEGLNSWNNLTSQSPDIAIDSSGTIHIVWEDQTLGPWTNFIEPEIFYANWSAGNGWSNATAISDGYMGSYWNYYGAEHPAIVSDNNDNLIVVYQQRLDLSRDYIEISCIKHTANGWSNASEISDGTVVLYKADGVAPAIASKGETIHIAWEGHLNGTWGYDSEIFYCTVVPTPAPALEPLEINANVVSLNWTNMPNATNYYIYIDTIEITDISSLTPIATSLTNSTTDTLTSDGIYYYVIVAEYPLGNSTISNCESITYDSTPPTSNTPSDTSYIYGSVRTFDNWILTDNIAGGYYQVLINDSVWRSWQPWTSGSNLSVDVNTTKGLGDWNYTIEYNDSMGLMGSSDTVIIHLSDVNPPHVIAPSDTSADANSTQNLSWLIYDDIGTGYFKILRNGTLHMGWNQWFNNTVFPMSINTNIGLGVWNYTIVFNDSYGLWGAPASVFVTVEDNTPPTVDSPSDEVIAANNTGETISWTLQDNCEGSHYYVWINSTIEAAPWTSWNDSDTVNVPVDTNIGLGDWNYTIIYNDTSGNWGIQDEVIITIEDQTNPTVNSPNDASYHANSTAIYDDWILTDNCGGGYYRVLIDGVEWRTWQSWTNDSNLSVEVDTNRGLGDWVYTIEYNDSSGLTGTTDSVTINIYDNTDPWSNNPSDSTYQYDEDNVDITWILYDDIKGDYYWVYKNESLWRQGNWQNESALQIDVDTNDALGWFNYTIVYRDYAGNYGIPDMVNITIIDSISPSASDPNDYAYPLNSDNNLTWILTDNYQGGYYRVLKNGSPYINWTNWNIGVPVDVPIDTSSIGTYEYIIEYNDSLGNVGTPNTAIAWIQADDLPEVLVAPSDLLAKQDSSFYLNWTLIDDSGGSHYRIIANGTLGQWNSWSTLNNTPISIPVNTSTVGVFNYTIQFNDSLGQMVSDTVMVTVEEASTTTGGGIPGFEFLFLVITIIGLIYIYLRKKGYKNL